MLWWNWWAGSRVSKAYLSQLQEIPWCFLHFETTIGPHRSLSVCKSMQTIFHHFGIKSFRNWCIFSVESLSWCSWYAKFWRMSLFETRISNFHIIYVSHTSCLFATSSYKLSPKLCRLCVSKPWEHFQCSVAFFPFFCWMVLGILKATCASAETKSPTLFSYKLLCSMKIYS